MRIAMEDLGLSEIRIICPGNVVSRLDERITVIGLSRLPEYMA
jgi:hypothetical protein